MLEVRSGKAYMRHIKRNARNLAAKAKPPRLVKLPKSLRTQIALVEKKGKFQFVGAEFPQLLERYRPWQTLTARHPDLTPYSLRHEYARRAHCSSANQMHPRIAAVLMGHSVATHLRHYGQ